MGRAIDKVRQNVADRAKELVPLSIRRRVVKARLALRVATARFRTAPDFLVIGAQRSGTSSLYKWLSRHPNVAPSLRKEVEYFSVDFLRGERWYRAHFPVALRRKLASFRGRAWKTFEATPDYLFDPRAPQRVAEALPNAKLIVLLRDPIDRAVSHYHHSVRNNLEDLPLEEALRREVERLEPEWSRIARDPGYRALPFRRFSYVARSRYAEQLERWRSFFPESQMLVMRSEDLFADPSGNFATVLRFLDLPPWEPPEFRNYSYTNALDGNYDRPDQAVQAFLDDALGGSAADLEKLLGTSFIWDQTAAP